jgi:hypothetical protein
MVRSTIATHTFKSPEHFTAKIEGEFQKLVVERLREALQGTDARRVLAVTLSPERTALSACLIQCNVRSPKREPF